MLSLLDNEKNSVERKSLSHYKSVLKEKLLKLIIKFGICQFLSGGSKYKSSKFNGQDQSSYFPRLVSKFKVSLVGTQVQNSWSEKPSTQVHESVRHLFCVTSKFTQVSIQVPSSWSQYQVWRAWVKVQFQSPRSQHSSWQVSTPVQRFLISN
jgi:hypothetical protein